jgi:hypothetical protein
MALNVKKISKSLLTYAFICVISYGGPLKKRAKSGDGKARGWQGDATGE